jgi:hypothetical protein
MSTASFVELLGRDSREEETAAVIPAMPGSPSTGMTRTPGAAPPKRFAWLRLLHAFFMLVSWYMIIGAGAAFTSNARLGAFPYAQADPSHPTTDSLIGRCFARNLTDPQAPLWLSELDCGLGAYCSSSSRGGSNSWGAFKGTRVSHAGLQGAPLGASTILAASLGMNPAHDLSQKPTADVADRA